MAISPVSVFQIIPKEQKNHYLFPLILVTSLFFLWGLWPKHLPEIKEDTMIYDVSTISKPLFHHKNFINAIIAQFFYVAAQVSIAAWFINYCTENNTSITNAEAANLLSISLLLFTAGRFVGTALMRKIAPNRLLFLFPLINIILCILVISNKSWLPVYSLMGVFFFESMMFPSIFALGLKDLRLFIYYYINCWWSVNVLPDGSCSRKIFSSYYIFSSGDLFCNSRLIWPKRS
jgi:FHS family L-fucose permease-like MFS transporter